MKYNKLLDEEKAIEDEIENLKPVSEMKKKKIEQLLSQARKNKSISLRISNFDLEKLKEKANNEGVPYQTLINSILHKYITNQLFEKDQILKTYKLLTKS
ncbi:BrnA antitoxin family protein [bacterium]|nr:BrnA antitoxin family protein [bacterium]